MNNNFIEAVEEGLKGIKFVSGGKCTSCPEYTEWEDDGSFSWGSCDCCDSTLGGDRYIAHGIIDGDLIHLNVCIDCLLYIANGEIAEDGNNYNPIKGE